MVISLCMCLHAMPSLQAAGTSTAACLGQAPSPTTAASSSCNHRVEPISYPNRSRKAKGSQLLTKQRPTLHTRVWPITDTRQRESVQRNSWERIILLIASMHALQTSQTLARPVTPRPFLKLEHGRACFVPVAGPAPLLTLRRRAVRVFRHPYCVCAACTTSRLLQDSTSEYETYTYRDKP
jgi:hypothetical protein